jgi:hypothetical protein
MLASAIWQNANIGAALLTSSVAVTLAAVVLMNLPRESPPTS